MTDINVNVSPPNVEDCTFTIAKIVHGLQSGAGVRPVAPQQEESKFESLGAQRLFCACCMHPV